MPTYLCHGFRWHRRDIRIFVILHDLEDAAPNWLIGPATSFAILTQMHAQYDFLPEPPPKPDLSAPALPPAAKRPLSPLAYDPATGLMHRDDDHSIPPPRVAASSDRVLMNSSWSPVKLLEEFDPEDMTLPSRPYAYVADYVVRIDLSGDVVEEMAKYRVRQQEAAGGEWFNRLRDELQKGEDIRWYVVVCGDDVREVPGESESESEGDDSDDDDDMIGEETPIEVVPDGLRPPPARTSPDQRPRTSPAGAAPSTSSLGSGSIPFRPSPLGSHPANPVPKIPPEPIDQKPLKSPPRPPLRNKRSMAEGLRRLFGTKKDREKKET